MPWSCQIATRLVFAWCGCNLVKKRQVIATSKTCGCNIWCAAIAKKRQLQNQDVGDCLRPYSSVIATAAYVCFGKKRKKNNWASVWLQQFGKRDCNQKLCVLQNGNLTLSVCLQSYLIVWNMIPNLGSKWLQKTKVSHCKICWFISVTARKEKRKLNQYVIAKNLH
jgi:hypothetical protein